MTSLYLLLVLTCVRAQEVATPSSLLSPRNYNHHAFNAKQYLRELTQPKSTKQGPVLFPNDGPPPPRRPLVVTSRPLLESIARSDLANNSIPDSTQLNHIVRPFLARVKEYRPFQYFGTQDYEERTQPPLLPIYKVLSDHAKQKVLEIQRQKQHQHHYQPKKPVYAVQYKNRDITRQGSGGDDDLNKNYAFSYAVRDQKTGDDFSHTQHSSGSATNGEYRVRLPDGRMQIVSYRADENGYQADVRYDDEDKTAGNTIQTNHNKYKNYFTDKANQVNNYNHINDVYHNDYSDKAYDKHYEQKVYQEPEKLPPNNDYYTDLSKEYYNDDFSSEYESKSYDYAPHRSKFTSFLENKADLAQAVPKSNFVSSTAVTPSYDVLKDLLVTKKAYNTIQPYISKIPIEINSPATTPSTFEATTERVVLIGGKKPNLYTSISNSAPYSAAPVPVTPIPITYDGNYVVSSTPQSYLVSTIASLKNKVDLSGPTPVLSKSYIDRINKYLRFN